MPAFRIALCGQADAAALARLFHRAVHLTASRAYSPARPVFERRGFRVLTAQTVTLRGQDFLNYRMEKRLADS